MRLGRTMTIDALVTGGNGFTGSQLSNELARRGKRVRALVRDESKIGLLDPTFLKNKQIELFRGDVRNLQEVQAAVNGVTDVYHIAALYRTAKHARAEYVDVNVGGTQNILQAALHHDVRRVLHCSTIGVHGGVSQIPANEDADIRAGDIYQQTKWQGERLARAAIEEGRRVTIVRPAGIYGPGDLRFLKLFSMVQRRRFIMFGSGDTLMHMVFIDDLVDGMIRAAELENGLGQTFILAGERYCS